MSYIASVNLTISLCEACTWDAPTQVSDPSVTLKMKSSFSQFQLSSVVDLGDNVTDLGHDIHLRLSLSANKKGNMTELHNMTFERPHQTDKCPSGSSDSAPAKFTHEVSTTWITQHFTTTNVTFSRDHKSHHPCTLHRLCLVSEKVRFVSYLIDLILSCNSLFIISIKGSNPQSYLKEDGQPWRKCDQQR